MEISQKMVEAAKAALRAGSPDDDTAIEQALRSAFDAREAKSPAPIKSWATLQHVARDGYRDAIEVSAAIELWQQGQDQEVFLAANSSAARQAFSRLSLAITNQALLMVVRAYGRSTRKDDRHLRAAIEFLMEPGRLEQDHEYKDRKRLEHAIETFSHAKQNSILGRLKGMRNKRIAHVATYKIGVSSPTYTDLSDFASVTTSIWESLALGVGVESKPLAHHLPELKASAAAFWEAATGKKPS